MSSLTVQLDASQLDRLANRLAGLNGPLIIARAINHTGDKAKTAVIKSLVEQTGLKRKVIAKAVRVRRSTSGMETRGKAGRAEYTLYTRGGDISLKYFGARETAKGVSAAPAGRRFITQDAFILGGRPGHRVPIGKLGGHVFKREGKGRLKIVKQVSDVSIPDQMLKGATKQSFEQIATQDLSARIEHEINYALNTGGF